MKYRQASPMTYRPCMCQLNFPDWSSRLVLASLPARNCWGTYTDLCFWIIQCTCWKFSFPWQSFKLEEVRDHNFYLQHFFVNKSVMNYKIKLLTLIAENYTQYIYFTQLSHMHANTLSCCYQIRATVGRPTPAISSEAEDCIDTTRSSRLAFRKCFKQSLVSIGVYIYTPVIPVCR